MRARRAAMEQVTRRLLVVGVALALAASCSNIQVGRSLAGDDGSATGKIDAGGDPGPAAGASEAGIATVNPCNRDEDCGGGGKSCVQQCSDDCDQSQFPNACCQRACVPREPSACPATPDGLCITAGGSCAAAASPPTYVAVTNASYWTCNGGQQCCLRDLRCADIFDRYSCEARSACAWRAKVCAGQCPTPNAGTCVDAAPQTGLTLGSLCESDGECAGGQCHALFGSGARYCTASCNNTNFNCPSNGRCHLLNGTTGYCLRSCANGEACAQGLTCQQHPHYSSVTLVCLPAGTFKCAVLNAQSCATTPGCRCQHYSACDCDCPDAEKAAWSCNAPLGCSGCAKTCFGTSPACTAL